MPDPELYEPARLTDTRPPTSRPRPRGSRATGISGSWNEISDGRAREDLGRLSAQMMSIVARSARIADGKNDVVPDEVVAQGSTAAETFLLRWRGEADPRHAKAIDTYWICTAEHGLNASTFTARVVASIGADCGASLSAAVGALSGPLHGGALAYVKPMLEEVAAHGDAEGWVRDALASGKRIMGFGHRVYRAEDPRSRLPQAHRAGAGSPYVEVAEEPSRLRSWRSRSATPSACSPRTSSTTWPSCSTSPRSRRRSPRRCSPARVAGLVGAHPRAEAD